jgi:hypothetical protein
LMIRRAHHCRYAVFKVRRGAGDCRAPKESPPARERPGERGRTARVSPPARPRSHVGPRACALPQSRTARHPRPRSPTTNPFEGVRERRAMRMTPG